MHDSDYRTLREKAAECCERASRARDEKQRTLWLELAEEIAGRLALGRAGGWRSLDA